MTRFRWWLAGAAGVVLLAVLALQIVLVVTASELADQLDKVEHVTDQINAPMPSVEPMPALPPASPSAEP